MLAAVQFKLPELVGAATPANALRCGVNCLVELIALIVTSLRVIVWLGAAIAPLLTPSM